ncbi:MAG: hypothetical protein RLZZ534_948 [Actinomycetota bacterium]
MLALLEILGTNHPPSSLRHRPHLISLSTQNSLSEKTLAQVAEIFATPVGSRVVLDTSVLVADPNCLSCFPNCAIVIPLTVIEELDGLKARMDDVGRSARSALRSIEELRRKAGGSLKDPTPINGTDTSGTVQIEVNGIQHHLLIEHGLDPKVPDNRIIGAALGQAAISPTCIVSNDAALRIKAAHLGLTALEHRPVGGGRNERPMGWSTFDTTVEVIDGLYKTEGIEKSEIERADGLYENNFAVLRCGSQSALTRCHDNELRLIQQSPPEAWGLRARNKEQRFALELLLDPQITVVALDGRAGTGKTVLAIAAGLEQVVEQHRDVGFLPGGLEEKLDPWMSAIHDAVVALTDDRSSRDAHGLIDDLIARGQLTLESVTFLRGRSLQAQIVVVDEAQNLEPTTLKTILTRIGDGTKVVFTGDTSQIDAPYMGESNNALAVLVQAFAGQSCFGHITLEACERSQVASLAAELL